LIRTLETDRVPGNFTIGFGQWAEVYSDRFTDAGSTIKGVPFIPVVSYVKPKTSLYGGTSEATLGLTNYIYAGHFQKVDATFLADIKSGDTYIMNNVQVFGGDTYYSIFDICRNMKDEFLETDTAALGYSHTIMVPLQSNINLGLRQGRHVARDRVFEDGGTWSAGVSYTTTANDIFAWEEFLYDDSYSSDNVGFVYPGLPANFANNERFDVRVRWTPQKFLGSRGQDAYRLFYANDYRDLETGAGQINRLAAKLGRLYYWQNHGVGYLPILERALSENTAGNPIQLGVGGVFDRYDQVVDKYGLQHKFAWCETDYGFTWYDFVRRTFIDMSVGFGLQKESIIKGLDLFFQNDINLLIGNFNQSVDYPIYDPDQPISQSGITFGYDPRLELTYASFKYRLIREQGNTIADKTIIFDNKLKKFVSHSNQDAGLYITHDNYLYSVNTRNYPVINSGTTYVVGDKVIYYYGNYYFITFEATSNFTHGSGTPIYDPKYWKVLNYSAQVWQNNEGAIGCYYGVYHDSTLEMIISNGQPLPAIWDNMVETGNDKYFDEIVYSNDHQTATDFIQRYVHPVWYFVSRNYKFLKRRWYHNIPFSARERMNDDEYLSVKYVLHNSYSYLDSVLGYFVTLPRNMKTRILNIVTSFRHRL
jgi:hypothetical protein